jgi:mitochondrial fission protein ELM1
MSSVGYQPVSPLKVWAVSGVGIAAQALGLAEAIARRAPATITSKTVALRSPYSFFPSGFVPAVRHALTDNSDPIKPPWPDIWIGCGRATVPLSMGVRTWSRGRTFVIQLQDPRVNPREFDLVAAPTHDELEGPNVVATIGACHRVTGERVREALEQHPTRLDELPGPRFAVLIGGKSRRQDIGARRAQEIAEALTQVAKRTGGSLMVTLSRRTGEAARLQLRARLAPHCALFFEGDGLNPYFAMLGAADAIFITADSVNMAAEAAATGKPIHILPVDGAPGKLSRFHEALAARGCARPFTWPLAFWTYQPLAETDRVAAIALNLIQARLERNR